MPINEAIAARSCRPGRHRNRGQPWSGALWPTGQMRYNMCGRTYFVYTGRTKLLRVCSFIAVMSPIFSRTLVGADSADHCAIRNLPTSGCHSLPETIWASLARIVSPAFLRLSQSDRHHTSLKH